MRFVIIRFFLCVYIYVCTQARRRLVVPKLYSGRHIGRAGQRDKASVQRLRISADMVTI